MYTKIMVPVDLAHADKLDKALTTATDLARHYRIPVCYVGVTAQAPTSVAHTPKEYGEKLQAFGASQAERHGIEVAAESQTSWRPAESSTRPCASGARRSFRSTSASATCAPVR